MKKRIIFVYNNLGIGGIAKELIQVLKIIDYSKFDVTVYIRRDDVVDLSEFVPPEVELIIVKNDVKRRVFDDGFKGKIVKFIYTVLKKRHKHLAKEFFIAYKYPIQRKKEKKLLDDSMRKWDTAICYSTDGDDPLFVEQCVNASKKYAFVHQSTRISKRNIKSLRRFDALLTVNVSLVEWVSEWLKRPELVYVLENCIDAENIREKAGELSFSRQKKTVISTCGRLCFEKGYDLVVETASILKKANVEFLWYWVGGGSGAEDMNKQIEDNELKDCVEITGMLKNPYPYINACDLYIQPSRAEAFPLTIVEALALGKPTICVRNYGSERIVEKYDSGMLTDLSAKEIAERVLERINNPLILLSEKEKVESIDWNNEKERFIDDWNSLLEDNLIRLREFY